MHRRRKAALVVVPALIAVASSSVASPSSVVQARLSGSDRLPAGCAEGTPVPDAFAATPGLERETATAVDPTSPRRRAVAWLQDDARAVVVARTTDGGRHWRSSVVNGIGACGGGPSHQRYVFHPRLAFGPDGRLWLATMAVRGAGPDPRNLVSEVLVTTSTGMPGAPWSLPVQLAELQGALGDLDTLAVHPRRSGTAYVAHDVDSFAPGQRVGVSRSSDGGRTWTRSEVALLTPGDVSFGRVLALEGSTVLLATTQTPAAAFGGVELPSRLLVYRSTDGGATWTAAPTLATGAAGVRHGEWPGLVSSGDGTTHLVWREPTATGGAYVVRTSRSTDDGATWSAPVEAGRGTTTAVATGDLGAAASPRGDLGVVLVDLEGSRATVRALTSGDSGLSWQDRTLISDVDLSGIPDGDPGHVTDVSATRDALVAAVPLGGPGWAQDGPTDVYALEIPWRIDDEKVKGRIRAKPRTASRTR